MPVSGVLQLNGTNVNSGDPIFASDIASNLLIYTPATNANGNSYASFTFEVNDDGGTAFGGIDRDQSANTITFDVTPTNDAPTVANTLADQTATEDAPFNFTFAANTFNDVDVGDTLTYSSNASGWLSFDAATRTFSGTPLNADVGTTTVIVTADDGNGGSVSDSFAIVVANTNDAPTVANALADQTGTEDAPFSFQFAANTFNDVDAGDTLTYSSNASGWLSFDAATRTFIGTPLNADVVTTTVTVTADDGNGGSVSSSFNLVVSGSQPNPGSTSGTDPTDFFGMIPEIEIIDNPGTTVTSNSNFNSESEAVNNIGNANFESGVFIEVKNAIEEYNQNGLPKFLEQNLILDEDEGSHEEGKKHYRHIAFKSNRIVNDLFEIQSGELDGGRSLESKFYADDSKLSEDLMRNIELMRSQIDDSNNNYNNNNFKVEYIAATSIGVSAGFVSWILRGGSLMASFLSSVPLFREFDPLPIAMRNKKADDKNKSKIERKKLRKKSADSMFG